MGRVADRAGHGLGMDAVLASRQIGLLVQHLVPFFSFMGDPVPEFGVGFCGDLFDQ